MSENSAPKKILIDDRALVEIKGFAKREWDDYRRPPEQVALILIGLANYLRTKGIEPPFEVKK